MKVAATVLALVGSSIAAPTAANAKYCDAATSICYTELSSTNGITYRFAIPDTATAAPFDILLQIVAPKAIGWAAIAWGGAMSYNPLTVGWSSGSSAIVSSRRATGHTMPAAYPGASYKTFPSSTTNATHWVLDVLCSGCSQWTDNASKTVSISPSSTAQTLAWGSSARAPTTPASNTSTFAAHDAKNKFTLDVSSAKLANFTSLVAKLGGTL